MAEPKERDAEGPQSGTRQDGLAARHSSAPPKGLPLPDRYVDLGPIARGGWGEVRRVRDKVVDRVVAMKILATEHVDSERLLSRFLHEANVTASLEHPGIVPVHDRGVLPDERPWFTMKEVRGQTLQHFIHAGQQGEDRTRWLRRAGEIFARVCETVGYAHERGVIHRDLKPSNVMVGEFGEVLVMDWGIARAHTSDVPEDKGDLLGAETGSLTQTGDILGTVAYMSPEQARGANEQLTPASDVFALGLVLYELLTGQRARPDDRVQAWAQAAIGTVPRLVPNEPQLPEELCAIYERSVKMDGDDRYPSAKQLGDAVRAWLDGSARRERAARSVAAAQKLVSAIEALRARRDAVRAKARRILATIRDHDPIDIKRPAWALEDEVSGLDQRIALLEAERVETLRAALEHDPEHRAAHAALASHYRGRMIDAEDAGDAARVATYELMLRRHDRGEHARFLENKGRLELDSDPSGAAVRAFRYISRDRRLVPEPLGEIGRTPIAVDLTAGSYLLELEHEGRAPARVPVKITRDSAWGSIRPGSERATPVRLLETLGPDEVYVPAGWVPLGGDPLAPEPIPSREVWVDGFVMRRCSVTCAEYLEFLDAISVDRATALAPLIGAGIGSGANQPLAVERRADGRWALRSRDDGLPYGMEFPIASIDWYAAIAFAEWRAETTGLPWRLPSEIEWEKAARGVDRRAFPWGSHPEPTFARIVGSSETLSHAPVGVHPVDESPYGARDMAGNVRNWCLETWTIDGPGAAGSVLAIEPPPTDHAPRSVRGGAWSAVPAFARSAGRFAAPPATRYASTGVRLVRSCERR